MLVSDAFVFASDRCLRLGKTQVIKTTEAFFYLLQNIPFSFHSIFCLQVISLSFDRVAGYITQYDFPYGLRI